MDDVISNLKRALEEQQSNINGKEGKLIELRNQLESGETTNAELKNQVSGLNKDLKTNKLERKQLSVKVDDLQSTLDNLDKQYQARKEENQDLQKELKELRNEEKGIVGKIASVLTRSRSSKVCILLI